MVLVGSAGNDEFLFVLMRIFFLVTDVVTIQDRTSEEVTEPYEIWKQRILSEARQALLKNLPKASHI